MRHAQVKKINKEKSTIVFSHSTSRGDRERVKQVLELNSETKNERYLGLPAHVNHSKQEALNISSRKSGPEYKGGRRSCCPWQ
jgi:hypothetical protein